MLPDQVSNPGPLTYESGALPIALRGPASQIRREHKAHHDNIQKLRWHVEKTYSYACRTINARLKLQHLIILKHKNNEFPT